MDAPSSLRCAASVRGRRSFPRHILTFTALILALLVAVPPFSALAATCHLPGDHPTLQGCIDAIAEGDTVLVAPGVYFGPGNRDIHTDGKNVTVIGEAGAEVTIFDAEQTSKFFTFSAGTETTRIQGLALRNGHGSFGGAVHIGRSVTGIGPAFVDCRFIANRSPWSGGAVLNEGDALVRFTRCHFEDNSAGQSGGAIEDRGGFLGSDVTLEHCTLIRNTAAFLGGAIAETGSRALNLSDCALVENTAPRGGALFLGEVIPGPGPPGSRLRRSPSEPDGARRDEFGLVTDCSFVGNEAEEGGAVDFSSHFTPVFQRCLFTDNVAGQGGVICGTNGRLESCTLVGNRGDAGAAVYDDPDLSFHEHVLVNCIVAFNGPDQAIRRPFPNGCTHLECSDVFGNEGGDWVGCIADQFGTAGNISGDPVFCDAPRGDFTLHAASPCAPANAPPGCGLIGALPVGCGTTTITGERARAPKKVRLTVIPNPVRSGATFTFDGIESPALEIYDPNGRLIDLLRPTGPSAAWLPGDGARSGAYFARLRGEGGAQVVKFLVVK